MKAELKELENYETLESWFEENLSDQVEDIAKYGCRGGVNGLIYYTETVAKYDKYNEEIFDKLHEFAEDQGISIPELIATFNGHKNVGSSDQLKNLLVWFYIETLAQDEWDSRSTKINYA